MTISARGYALASLLLLGAVVLVVSLTIAGVGNYQLLTAENLVAQRSAEYLADGLVRWVAGQLAANAKYAPSGVVLTYPTAPTDPEHCAQLTFDVAVAKADGLPYSTNNYNGTQSSGYNHSLVPNGAVQIIAVGHCGRATRTVEAIVTVAPFPYAVAAACGASLGYINVEAAASMTQYSGSVQHGIVPCAAHASVGSNGALSARGFVSGNVVYGTTLCSPGLQVGGSVRRGQICFPQLCVPCLEAHIPCGAAAWPPGLVCGNVTLNSCHVYYINPGSKLGPGTYCIAGNLVLSNAELFVCGCLNVQGGVSGLGGVFVNGNVTISGNAQVNAVSDVALDAEGCITLKGNGKNYFQGLVYSHGGKITANSITVVGAMVAAPKSGSGGTVALGSCGPVKVVFVPCVMTQHLQTTPQASNWATYSCASSEDVFHGCPWGPLLAGGGQCLGAQYADSLPNCFVPMGGMYGGGCWLFPGWNGGHPVNPSICEKAAQCAVHCSYMAAMAASPYASIWSHNTQLAAVESCCGPGAALEVISLHYNALNNDFEMWQPPMVYGVDVHTSGAPLVSYATLCAQLKQATGISADQYKNMLLYAQQTYANLSNLWIQKGLNPAKPPATPPPYPINLDLSKFLSTSNPVRIISWKSW